MEALYSAAHFGLWMMIVFVLECWIAQELGLTTPAAAVAPAAVTPTPAAEVVPAAVMPTPAAVVPTPAAIMPTPAAVVPTPAAEVVPTPAAVVPTPAAEVVRAPKVSIKELRRQCRDRGITYRANDSKATLAERLAA